MRNATWIVAILAAIVATGMLLRSGSLRAQAAPENSGEGPTPGAVCQVYLRGDAAGMSWHDRIADLGNLISRKGTCISSDATWLVLRDGNTVVWIPRTSIILIEAAGAPAKVAPPKVGNESDQPRF